MRGLLILCLFFITACKSENKFKARYVEYYQDNETGCEYLATNDGGLYPRISTDGKSHKGCWVGEMKISKNK